MIPGECVIYVDESGDPDVWSRRRGPNPAVDLLKVGLVSNHLVIAALRCPDPNVVARAVTGLIEWANRRADRQRRRGHITYLHAGKDDDAVRRAVCEELSTLPVKATAIVMDKRLLRDGWPWREDKRRFYNEMAAYLLRDSLHRYERTRLIFSRKDKAVRSDLIRLVADVQSEWGQYVRKQSLTLPPELDISANHRAAASTLGLQAVDYVSWAVFRAFERGDTQHMSALQPIIRHVWDIGRASHYDRRHPFTV